MASPSEGSSPQLENKKRKHKGSNNNKNNNKNKRGGGRRGGPRPTKHPHQRGTVVVPSLQPIKKHSHHPFPLETRVIRAKQLGPSLPPLFITYTNEQETLAAWLDLHVPGLLLAEPKSETNPVHSGVVGAVIVGLDTETKPCFTREAALASQGPDTLQLAVADGHCLVVHLSRMERLPELESCLLSGISRGTTNTSNSNPGRSMTELLQLQQECASSSVERTTSGAQSSNYARVEGYVKLSKFLKSQQIAKVGVSIDDDALELLKNHLLETNCRLDLRNIDKDHKNDGGGKISPASGAGKGKKNPGGGNGNHENENDDQQNKPPKSLKGLAEFYVEGMVLPKIKRLQMSNWANQLSDAQIGYAAADAFAGAIVVSALEASSEHKHTKESLIRNVIQDEVDIVDLRELRELRKQERKRAQEKRRNEKKKHKGTQQGSKKQKNKKTSMKKLHPISASSKEVVNSNQNSNSPNHGQSGNHRNKRNATSKGHRAADQANPLYAQLQTSLSSAR